jgi:hypothetical protein
MSPFHWFEVSPEEISDSLLKNGTRRGFDVRKILLFFTPYRIRRLHPLDPLNLGIGSQHDGEPPSAFMTFERDLDKAGHGHRENHTNRSQNPSAEDH